MPETVEELVFIYPEGAEDQGIQRSISQKERDAIPTEDFAGPHQSFPIRNQDDVDSAAKLIGHADDPDAVKRNVIRIAKKKGLKLPDSWKEDDSKDSADSSNSADRFVTPEHPALYAPITRINTDKWEVEGIATSEAIDSYGTIFSYDASKKAFQRWIERTANVREMHDRKAVGKGVNVFFDDANKQIAVRLRVSRGAQDTWLKIQDDVLAGLSVGATNPTWGKIERNGKTYPYLTSYDLAELSLVDNASNPDGQGLSLCRADGLTEVVDTTEPEIVQSVQEQQPTENTSDAPSPQVVERAGARLSADTQTGLHAARDSNILGAVALMNLCGCDECQSMINAIDPDGDGDIDLPGAGPDLDPDQDADALAERIVDRVAERILSRLDAPVLRMHTIAGQFARIQTPDIDLSPIQRSIDALEARFADVVTTSGLDEVRSLLSEVKGQVDVIAKQPAAGGPLLNGAAVDKRFATQSYLPAASTEEEERRVLERLRNEGKLNNHELQTAAAATRLTRM